MDKEEVVGVYIYNGILLSGVYIYTREYYSDIKRIEILPLAKHGWT